MKHVISFFILAIISSLTAQSQDTTDYHLEIILQDEYGMGITDIDSLDITIFNDDTVLVFQNAEYSIQLDIPEGNYSLKAEGSKYYSTNISNIEVRLGFGASYRLTEYLKGDYPEMPRLMLSLTLTAPTI